MYTHLCLTPFSCRPSNSSFSLLSIAIFVVKLAFLIEPWILKNLKKLLVTHLGLRNHLKNCKGNDHDEIFYTFLWCTLPKFMVFLINCSARGLGPLLWITFGIILCNERKKAIFILVQSLSKDTHKTWCRIASLWNWPHKYTINGEYRSFVINCFYLN